METFQYKDWTIEYDRELTAHIYGDLPSGPEQCDCAVCKNFIAVRPNFYPDEFKEMLNSFGIDCQKEAEVTRFHTIGPGLHLCSGYFHLVGNILQSPPGDKHPDIGQVPKYKDFEWTFIRKSYTDKPKKPFGKNDVVQIGWFAAVPWTIDIPEPA